MELASRRARRGGRHAMVVWAVMVYIGCCAVLVRRVSGAGHQGEEQHAQVVRQVDVMVARMEQTLEDVRLGMAEKDAELTEATGLSQSERERVTAEKKKMEEIYERTKKQVDLLHGSLHEVEHHRAQTSTDREREKKVKDSMARQLVDTHSRLLELRKHLEESDLAHILLVAADEVADELGDFLDSPRTADFLKVSATLITEMTMEGYDMLVDKVGAKKHGLLVRIICVLLTFLVPLSLTRGLLGRASGKLSARQYLVVMHIMILGLCVTFFFAALILRADPITLLQTSRHDNGFTVTFVVLCIAFGAIPCISVLLFRGLLFSASLQERLSYALQLVLFAMICFVWHGIFWSPLMKPSLVYVAPHPAFYGGFAAIFVFLTFLTIKSKVIADGESVAANIEHVIIEIENSVRDPKSILKRGPR